MILKILVFNLIITFGLLATGNIGWGIILHICNTAIACIDHVLGVVFNDDELQPPDDTATV